MLISREGGPEGFCGCGWGLRQEERRGGLAAWAPALRGATRLDLVCTDKTHGRRARDGIEAPRDPGGRGLLRRQMRGAATSSKRRQ